MAPKRTALLLLLPLSATLSTLFSRVECKIPPPDTSNQHRAVKAVATVPEIAKSQISGSNPVEDRIGEAEQASISLDSREKISYQVIPTPIENRVHRRAEDAVRLIVTDVRRITNHVATMTTAVNPATTSRSGEPNTSKCLEQYTTPVNLTIMGVFETSPEPFVFHTTILDVTTHWGVPGPSPVLSVIAWKSTACPPKSWDRFEVFDWKPSPAVAGENPPLSFCSTMVSAPACTDRVSCVESCKITDPPHHSRFKKWWLALIIPAVVLTLLALIWAVTKCCRRRRKGGPRPTEKKEEHAPKLVTIVTPAPTDGTLDLDGAAGVGGQTPRDSGSCCSPASRAHLLSKNGDVGQSEKKYGANDGSQGFLARFGLGRGRMSKQDAEADPGRRAYQTGSDFGCEHENGLVMRTRPSAV